jgi:hypothetical protein
MRSPGLVDRSPVVARLVIRATAEEIITNELEGNLVYASNAKKELQELHPKVKGGAVV